MKSMLLCLCAFTLFSAIGLVHCHFHSTTEIPPRLTQKKTSLHFFLHHSFKGSKPSSVIVAGANSSTGNNSLLSPFGTGHVLDEHLTEGPEPTSKVIGNAQGLLVSSGPKELSLAVYLDFGFTTGEFDGSSIVVASRFPVAADFAELEVVGGREKFRMTSGFVELKRYYFNETTGEAIGEWSSTLFYWSAQMLIVF
ncbi:dirigent protein 4-like [Vitis riparia]|uniref:dirigent protein 4-like n=1 Tax=Vitis riparia TaxID=96939 RepID=UPI00155A5160|nr:dirigent protein 4-like [Vitis riparia]